MTDKPSTKSFRKTLVLLGTSARVGNRISRLPERDVAEVETQRLLGSGPLRTYGNLDASAFHAGPPPRHPLESEPVVPDGRPPARLEPGGLRGRKELALGSRVFDPIPAPAVAALHVGLPRLGEDVVPHAAGVFPVVDVGRVLVRRDLRELRSPPEVRTDLADGVLADEAVADVERHLTEDPDVVRPGVLRGEQRGLRRPSVVDDVGHQIHHELVALLRIEGQGAEALVLPVGGHTAGEADESIRQPVTRIVDGVSPPEERRHRIGDDSRDEVQRRQVQEERKRQVHEAPAVLEVVLYLEREDRREGVGLVQIESRRTSRRCSTPR